MSGAEQSSAAIRRVLLSVEGLEVPQHQSIRGFRIDTWGVEFLAVCHIPPSWQLRSEKFEDPEGYLSGRADAQGERLGQLRDMYPVDVYDYQPLPRGNRNTEYHPASFSGWVAIGAREPFSEGRGRRRRLKPSNFHLKDAQACPAAPPARP